LCEQLLLSPDATVFCIARGKDQADAKRRILDNLVQYCYSLNDNVVNIINQGFENRTVVLLGDIGLAHFGLDDQTWNLLSTELDAIIHCGATVNFIMNYDQLKSVNVGSVVECLKLCSGGNKLKALHFVSTISVVPNQVLGPNQIIAEDYIPLNAQIFQNFGSGYPQSKYVAENILKLAIKEKNIPSITIHRPGLVVGHSVNGFSNVREWISRLICGIVQLGFAPLNANQPVFTVPVDFVAKSIVSIANSKEMYGTLYGMHNISPAKNIFNLISIHNHASQHMTVELIVNVLKEMGYQIKEIPYNSWANFLRNQINSQHSYPTITNENTIFGILDLFPTQLDYLPSGSLLDGHLGCDNLKAALSLNETINCPIMNNSQIIQSYIKYFMRCCDIEPPKQ